MCLKFDPNHAAQERQFILHQKKPLYTPYASSKTSNLQKAYSSVYLRTFPLTEIFISVRSAFPLGVTIIESVQLRFEQQV